MTRPLLLAALLCWPPAARAAAEATDGARRAEAAERFDRGMALLEEGDNAGALAELLRVYALAPHPQVLYNLGLVYAAMNRPIEATRTMEQVLAAPGALPDDSLARARRTRDEQARRVALLDVTTNVPATIETDGIEVGKTPLDKPIAIAAGTRVVAAVSPGYLPARKEITVAGQTTETLRLELAPTELRMAHLTVRAALPDAEVLVDGQRVGRTPLPGSLALPPGRRAVELRRDGYRSARREIALDDGASGELTFELAEDPGGGARPGRLALAVSEPDPDVTIDGQPRGAYRGPLPLPPGLHQVRIARAGFVPVERTVAVPPDAETTTKVTLVPTPETRAAYKRRAQLQRTWGRVGIIGGAALAVAAGTLVALNRGPLRDAEANTAAVVERCRVQIDKPAMEKCTADAAAADDAFNTHQTRQNVGLIVLGLGVVAAGVGTALLLTGDDPDRYDRPPRELAVSGWASPGGGGFALTGGF